MAIPRTARLRSEVPWLGTPKGEFLTGWKEIANYLNRGVRTIQRYERELGLPIRRPAKNAVGSVTAVKVELDGWVSARLVRVLAERNVQPVVDRANMLKADFLRIDSEVALTFSGIALGASDHDRRSRTSQAARKAYDTVIRLREGVDLTDAESNKLDANLQRLKSELQSLGQTF